MEKKGVPVTGPSMVAPSPPTCPCPHCSKAFKTEVALKIHISFCPSSPENAGAITRADEEAHLFASLFNGDAARDPAQPPAPVDSDDDEEVEEDGAGPLEAEPAHAPAPEAMDLDAVVAGPDTKGVMQRKAYSVKRKMQLLRIFDTIRASLLANEPARAVTQLRVARIVERNTGVKVQTFNKWLLARAKIREAYEEKKRHLRGKKKIGKSGRPPLFPKAEEVVAKEVKERRKKSLVVTRKWTMKRFQEEAKKESPDVAAKCRFSGDMFRAFLARRGLACRLPSCTKAMSLENGVLTGRGWLRWLLRLVHDEFEQTLATRLDPEYGRFPLMCRLNEDEVWTLHRDSPHSS